MSWLDKIEKRLKSLSKYRAGWRGNVERARMARVIRELAKGTRLLREAVVKEMVTFVVDEVAGEFLDNLSPDAKEVINDCAAPRSN